MCSHPLWSKLHHYHLVSEGGQVGEVRNTKHLHKAPVWGVGVNIFYKKAAAVCFSVQLFEIGDSVMEVCPVFMYFM